MPLSHPEGMLKIRCGSKGALEGIWEKIPKNFDVFIVCIDIIAKNCWTY